MKKTTLCMLVLGMFSWACNPGSDQGEFLRCYLDGELFEDNTENVAAYLNSNDFATVTGSSTQIVITGIVPNVTGSGTYPISIGAGAGEGEFIFSVNGTIYKIWEGYPASHGTITITEIGSQSPLRRIRGSFQGVAYNSTETDSIVVTAGEFSGW
ncbi:MAG: DUF6252 family protein [Flavobacteriales bacterium]|nr:DUF6252 family protein [Flavobacteriales bacterium]